MTKPMKDSRRDLRERAFQALLSLEFTGQALPAAEFAYVYDKELAEDTEVSVPLYLLNLVQGVVEHRQELDEQISSKLKAGWTLERLTSIDRTLLRLGLYEMNYFADTPDRVALNEAIELAKKYADTTSSKFINGLLRQFITEED